MTFKEWIKKFNKRSSSVEGDLARDILMDNDFPNTEDYKLMLTYLQGKGANDDVIKMFISMHNIFITEKHIRENNSLNSTDERLRDMNYRSGYVDGMKEGYLKGLEFTVEQIKLSKKPTIMVVTEAQMRKLEEEI